MNNDGISLRGYLAALRRRWLTVGLIVLVTVGAVAAYFMVRPATYAATTEIQLDGPRVAADSAQQGALTPEELQTQQRVAASSPVAERVIEALDLELTATELVEERMTIEVVSDTVLLAITATADQRSDAATLANTYAEAFVDYRRDRAAAEQDEARAELASQEENLRGQLADVEEQLASATPAEQRTLSARRDGLTSLLAQVSERTAGLAAADPGAGVGGVVVQPAQPDAAAVSPRPIRDGSLAVALGLLLGIGVALVRDHVDDTVYDERTVPAAGQDRLLGVVPHWSARGRAKGRSENRSRDRKKTAVPSPAALEAYQALNASLREVLRAGDPHSAGAARVLVTGAARGQGATSVATRLAVAAARAGQRVVLVDADLREPAVADRMGLATSTGLAEVLTSGGAAGDYLVQRPGSTRTANNLRLLLAGEPAVNAAELLAGPELSGVLDELAKHADLVIVDSGPSGLGDTIELATHTDLTLLVLGAGRVEGRVVTSTLNRYDRAGADIAVVCNGVRKRPD